MINDERYMTEISLALIIGVFCVYFSIFSWIIYLLMLAVHMISVKLFCWLEYYLWYQLLLNIRGLLDFLFETGTYFVCVVPGPSWSPVPGPSEPPEPQSGPVLPSDFVPTGGRVARVSLDDLESVLSRRHRCPWCLRLPDGSLPRGRLRARRSSGRRRQGRRRQGRGQFLPVPGLVPHGHRVCAPTWTPGVVQRGGARLAASVPYRPPISPQLAASGSSRPPIGHQPAANHSTDSEEDLDLLS